jgi:hypothetical protein
MFNLGCPMFAFFWQTWDLARRENLSPWGSRVVIVVESHFSQKTREMGHPKVLTFHPVRIADRCGPPAECAK